MGNAFTHEVQDFLLRASQFQARSQIASIRLHMRLSPCGRRPALDLIHMVELPVNETLLYYMSAWDCVEAWRFDMRTGMMVAYFGPPDKDEYDYYQANMWYFLYCYCSWMPILEVVPIFFTSKTSLYTEQQLSLPEGFDPGAAERFCEPYRLVDLYNWMSELETVLEMPAYQMFPSNLGKESLEVLHKSWERYRKGDPDFGTRNRRGMEQMTFYQRLALFTKTMGALRMYERWVNSDESLQYYLYHTGFSVAGRSRFTAYLQRVLFDTRAQNIFSLRSQALATRFERKSGVSYQVHKPTELYLVFVMSFMDQKVIPAQDFWRPYMFTKFTETLDYPWRDMCIPRLDLHKWHFLYDKFREFCKSLKNAHRFRKHTFEKNMETQKV